MSFLALGMSTIGFGECLDDLAVLSAADGDFRLHTTTPDEQFPPVSSVWPTARIFEGNI